MKMNIYTAGVSAVFGMIFAILYTQNSEAVFLKSETVPILEKSPKIVEIAMV